MFGSAKFIRRAADNSIGLCIKMGSLLYLYYPGFDPEFLKRSFLSDYERSRLKRKFKLTDQEIDDLIDMFSSTQDMSSSGIYDEIVRLLSRKNVQELKETQEKQDFLEQFTNNDESSLEKQDTSVSLPGTSIITQDDLSKVYDPESPSLDINWTRDLDIKVPSEPGYPADRSLQPRHVEHLLTKSIDLFSKRILANNVIMLINIYTYGSSEVEILLWAWRLANFTTFETIPHFEFLRNVFLNSSQAIRQYGKMYLDNFLEGIETAKSFVPTDVTFDNEKINNLVKKFETKFFELLQNEISPVIKNSEYLFYGILLQQLFNTVQSVPIEQYINVPPPKYGKKYRSVLEQIRNTIYNTINTALENCSDILLSSLKSIPPTSLIPALADELMKLLDTDESFVALDNIEFFDSKNWKNKVRNNLERLKETNMTELQHSPEALHIYDSLGTSIKQLFRETFFKSGQILREIFFEDDDRRRKRTTMRDTLITYDTRITDTVAVVGKIHTIVSQWQENYVKLITSNQTIENILKDLGTFTASMHLKRTYDLEIQYQNHFRNVLLRGIYEFFEKILQKTTILDIEHYLYSVLALSQNIDSLTTHPIVGNVLNKCFGELSEVFSKNMIVKSGHIINVNGFNFLVVAASGSNIQLADYDTFADTLSAPIEEYQQNAITGFKITASLNTNTFRKCSIGSIVVSQKWCSSCPYGVTTECSEVRCMFNSYIKKLASNEDTQKQSSIKVCASDELDKIMDCLELKAKTSPSDPIDISDRVVKNSSNERGVVVNKNYDGSYVIDWDSGVTSVAWKAELSKIVEDDEV